MPRSRAAVKAQAIADDCAQDIDGADKDYAKAAGVSPTLVQTGHSMPRSVGANHGMAVREMVPQSEARDLKLLVTDASVVKFDQGTRQSAGCCWQARVDKAETHWQELFSSRLAAFARTQSRPKRNAREPIRKKDTAVGTGDRGANRAALRSS